MPNLNARISFSSKGRGTTQVLNETSGLMSNGLIFLLQQANRKDDQLCINPFQPAEGELCAHAHTHSHEASSCLVKKLLKKHKKTKGETVQSHDFTGHTQAALLPIFSAVELFHAIMPDLTDEGVKSILNSLKNIKDNRQRIFH